MLKKTLNISISLMLLLCLLSSCSNAKEQSPQVKLPAPEKTLIVYLSRTNNTKAIAEIIQGKVGGDLVAIEMEKPYPKDYKATVAQVANENEAGFLPLLKTKIQNIEQYNVIYVGFPTWGMALPPPMKSFLRQYNLKGKTVIPFNTNAGYGIGSTFDTVKELCPDSKVLEGFTIKGGIERDGILLVIKDEKRKQAETEVVKWLRKINRIAALKKEEKMKKVIVIGASGSLAQVVIETLKPMPDVQLTLFVRNKTKLSPEMIKNTIVIEGNALQYGDLKAAISGQDIVYENLAGDLETMTGNIVKAMEEVGTKRIIAISSIGIYVTPLKSVLIPYRKLADIIEASKLDYTILRPDWFTNGNDIDFALTQKGEPEKGSAISRKSIATFIASLVKNPESHKGENLGISKVE